MKTITPRISKEQIVSFINGDKEAFDYLYNYFYKKIYFYALCTINDCHLSEDVVQNVFISAFNQRMQLKHPEAFHVWIMRITIGECNKIIYKESKHTKYDVIPEDSIIENNSSYPRVEKTIIEEIMNLNYLLKDVAMLKYYYGYKEKEISKILEIPIGTVKSRLSSIRSYLKTSLKERGLTPKTFRTYSITLPIVIKVMYDSHLGKTAESIKTSTLITSNVVQEGATTAVNHFAQATMNFVKVSFISLVITSGLYFGIQQPEEKTSGVSNIENNKIVRYARIEDISYSKNYTNKPIEVDIKINSGEFDYYLINGVKTNLIEENGEYTIDLYLDNKVIDTKTFIVSNIDVVKPAMIDYVLDENFNVNIKLMDDKVISKVIIYKENEVLRVSDIGEKSGIVSFFVESETNYNVYVYDEANNFLLLKVYEN